MKKILKHIQQILLSTIGLLLVLASSCSKDLGNYSYAAIDTLQASNLAEAYNVQLGAVPNIVPDLTFTSATAVNADDFTYEWVLYNTGASTTGQQRKIIATTKDLMTPIPFPVGTYPVYFIAKQKATGVTWTKKMKITIQGAFKLQGWFVLSEVANNARLDYYEDDNTNWHSYPTIYRGFTDYIYDGEKQMTLSGKPLSLASYFSRDYVNSATSKRYLYINTKDTTKKVNITDGMIWSEKKYAFKNETAYGQPTYMDKIFPTGSYKAYGVSNNTLYQYNYTYGVFYGTPINRYSTGAPYKMSPYFVIPASSTYMVGLIFDQDSRKFARSYYTTTYSSPLSSPTGAFDLGNVGKDVVWGGYTAAFAGQAVYVFKEGARYYLGRISFDANNNIVPISMTDITTELSGIATASHFAIDQQYGYLFYVSEGKLYQYDMDAKLLKVAYELGGKKVSLLKTQPLLTYAVGTTAFNANLARWAPVGYSIILGTYDESEPDTSGEVHFFEVKGLMGGVSDYPFSPFKGLGKVADVSYNEVN